MWPICNVVGLANVGSSSIRFAVRRMVAQWLHPLLRTFFHVRNVVISVPHLQSQPLKRVDSRVGAVSALQLAFERLIRFVRGCSHTHNIPGPSADLVPTVGIGVHAECLDLSPMWTSERAEVVGELVFQIRPTSREIRRLVEVRPVRHVVGLADVASSGISFAVRGMITERFHFLLGALVDHDGIHITACRRYSDFLELVLSSICAISAAQFAGKWCIWLVGRCFRAHDFFVF